MNRRELLLGGAALVAISTAAGAHEDKVDDHSHHHHGGGKYAELINALAECVSSSRDCIAHCLALFEKGDTETVQCVRLTYDVQEVCGTMLVLAHSGSAHLAEYGALTAKMCRDCGAECKKHADKHEVCKRCQEACEACAKQCENIA